MEITSVIVDEECLEVAVGNEGAGSLSLILGGTVTGTAYEVVRIGTANDVALEDPGRIVTAHHVHVTLLDLLFEDELGLDRHVITVGMLVGSVSDSGQEIPVTCNEVIDELDVSAAVTEHNAAPRG